jgi:hypothetical protein
MKLGIGISTFRRPALLAQCVEKVQALTTTSHQIVVADDGSGDETAQALPALPIKFITGRTMGVFWNKNRALFALRAVMQCDIIILIEDDIFPNERGWERTWIEAAQKFGHVNLAGDWLRDSSLGGTGSIDDPVLSESISGQVAAFSRVALENVGYMDTRFRGYGYGHADHSTRMIRAGYGGIIKDGRPVYFLIEGAVVATARQSDESGPDLVTDARVLAESRHQPIFRPAFRSEIEFKQLNIEIRSMVQRAMPSSHSRHVHTPQIYDPVSLYWERRYSAGGTSGAGSFGHLARYKAGFLNTFVATNRIGTVAELGCGDGEQLRRARYPAYTGYDISPMAVSMCRAKFRGDSTKSFYCLPEVQTLEPADLCISLDVMYHLVDDADFDEYLRLLFRIAARYVIIYGNGCVQPYGATHVKLRDFSGEIGRLYPGWMLINAERNPFYSEIGTDPNTSWSNFYIYEAPRRSWHSVFHIPEPRLAGLVEIHPQVRSAAEEMKLLAAGATHIAAVQPTDISLVAAALEANPSLTASIAHFGNPIDEAAAFAQCNMLSNTHGDRQVQLVSAPRLSDLLHEGECPPTDLVLLSSQAMERLSTTELRALALSGRSQTIFVAALAETSTLPKLLAAASRGYLREILPEMRGTKPAPNPWLWAGSLQVEPVLVVSLTSIRSRLRYLAGVIGSILTQSRSPDRLILNISEEGYLQDEGIPAEMLPHEIREFEESGLIEIQYVENMGPFRKLLPTLRSAWESNCVIVTADDDMHYPPYWLDRLYHTYLQSRCVVAYRCYKMLIENGRPRPYFEWAKPDTNDEVKPEYRDIFTFPTGGDGVLYHPTFFTEDVFDPELARIAPTADDIVFKLATMITETPVVTVPRTLSEAGRFPEFPPIEQGQGGLWELKLPGSNDESLARVLDYLGSRGVLDLGKFLKTFSV